MKRLQLLLMMLLTLPIGLLAAGTTWKTATALSLGQEESGSFSDDRTVEWWSFTVTADGEATVTVTPGSGLRISDVRLYYYEYGDSKEIVNYWTRTDNTHYFNPSWYAGSMNIPNLAPGSYLIKIERGEGVGSYTVKCDFIASTYANNKEVDAWNNANILTKDVMAEGHLGYGYAASSEDNYDWWAINVDTDGEAVISITPSANLRISDVRLYYYEYNDAKEIVNYWTRSDNTHYINPSWYAGNMRIPNLAPGTYLVRIERGEGQGGYELTYTAEPQEYANDQEPNNTWDTGLVNSYLPRGHEKQCHLGYGYTASSEDDEDWYRITVPRDGKAILTYTPTDVNSSLRVSDIRFYYIEGENINCWTRSSNNYSINPSWYSGTLTVPDLVPGDYLVKVVRGEGYGAYSLKYELEQNSLPNDEEPNNEWNQASKLIEGKTQSGHLGYGYANGNEDSYDWYEVTMSKNGTLKINIEPGEGLRISDVRLYYYEYDSNHEKVNCWQRTSGNYYINPSWYFGSLVTDDVEAGDYLVRVERGEGCGNYRIAFNADLTDVTPLDPLPEFEEPESDTSTNLIVWLSETEKHYYALSEKPKITMNNGDFTVTTSSTTVTYKFDDVLKFTLVEGDHNSLIVWLSETEKHYYDLSEKPKITMNNGDFTVTTSSATATYKFEDVLKFTLVEGGTTAIETVEAVMEPTIERLSDRVVFTGNTPKSAIRIYSLGGQLVDTQWTDESGRAEISIYNLAPGVYVVKTESKTIKIAKR